MAEVIYGAAAADEIKAGLKKTIEENGLYPCLAIIRVGEDQSNEAYRRGINKVCDQVGIIVKDYFFSADISMTEFKEKFAEINDDKNTHGILLFRPLPSQLDERTIAEMLDPEKDMDCMSPVNWAKLAMGDDDGYYPCTAEAVIRICDHAGVDINGKKAVVLGRSLVIGRPAGLMLLARNATVTWCHSKTENIAEACRNADILVSACGKAAMVGKEIASVLSPDCIAIDVGINFVDGRMCGDLDFEAVSACAAKITPVPGGVGAVTSSVMASHVVRSALKAKLNN